MKYEEGRWWIYDQRRRDLECGFEKKDEALSVQSLAGYASRYSLAPLDGHR